VLFIIVSGIRKWVSLSPWFHFIDSESVGVWVRGWLELGRGSQNFGKPAASRLSVSNLKSKILPVERAVGPKRIRASERGIPYPHPPENQPHLIRAGS